MSEDGVQKIKDKYLRSAPLCFVESTSLQAKGFRSTPLPINPWLAKMQL